MVPYDVATVENWVVVSILLPIVIALYLLLVLLCYYIFCKQRASAENQEQHFASVMVSLKTLYQ